MVRIIERLRNFFGKGKWSWVAACIDCDGYITLNIQNKASGSKAIVYDLAFTSDNEGFSKEFGKKISIGKMVCWKDKRGLHYRWTIRNFSDLKKVLPKIIPYLYLKKQKARILLKYVNLRLRKGASSTCPIRYSDEEYKLVGEFHEKE